MHRDHFFLSIIGGHADHVAPTRRVWTPAQLAAPGSTASSFSVRLDGGGEGIYEVQGTIRRTRRSVVMGRPASSYEFGPIADVNGDGRDEVVVTSPWGLGILGADGTSFRGLMLAANGTRFGGWLLNTADNRLGPVADVNGDGRDEVVISSGWGPGILRFTGSTLEPVMMASNGTRFGGWLLGTDVNVLGPVGDFDGDGREEIVISSGWGMGILRWEGSNLVPIMMAANGTRFGGWLLNTGDNRFGPVGDLNGDGRDELVISSPWGMGILRFNGSTLEPVMMASNETRFGGWLLNTADNHLRAAARFGRSQDDLFVTSP